MPLITAAPAAPPATAISTAVKISPIFILSYLSQQFLGLDSLFAGEPGNCMARGIQIAFM